MHRTLFFSAYHTVLSAYCPISSGNRDKKLASSGCHSSRFNEVLVLKEIMCYIVYKTGWEYRRTYCKRACMIDISEIFEIIKHKTGYRISLGV